MLVKTAPPHPKLNDDGDGLGSFTPYEKNAHLRAASCLERTSTLHLGVRGHVLDQQATRGMGVYFANTGMGFAKKSHARQHNRERRCTLKLLALRACWLASLPLAARWPGPGRCVDHARAASRLTTSSTMGRQGFLGARRPQLRTCCLPGTIRFPCLRARLRGLRHRCHRRCCLS